MWLRVEDGGTDAVGLLRVTLSGGRYREGQKAEGVVRVHRYISQDQRRAHRGVCA